MIKKQNILTLYMQIHLACASSAELSGLKLSLTYDKIQYAAQNRAKLRGCFFS